jgi:hypothetical protein
MNYWLDLFTGTTWKEFREAGATVSGFNERMRNQAAKIKEGDILLCYLTGVMRWVGALKVIGDSKNKSPIWKNADYPIRFQVEPLVMLDPEYGVPMATLEGSVAFYEGPEDRGKFKAFIRMSPNRFADTKDGELIMELLAKAKEIPVLRPVDPKKLARTPWFKVNQKKGKAVVPAVVSIPESEEEETLQVDQEESPIPSKHTEIQYELLMLGVDMGFDVWVARNDKSKTWKGIKFSSIPEVVEELPTQFNDATNKTIELIDVLWLKGNSIVAAFEIEHTTSVYSGLLRMSDLLALQPNLEIKIFLIAPDERRDKVQQEILRPTFALKDKPLHEICGFIGFSTLSEKLKGIRSLGLQNSLKPEFLESVAEYFNTEEA